MIRRNAGLLHVNCTRSEAHIVSGVGKLDSLFSSNEIPIRLVTRSVSYYVVGVSRNARVAQLSEVDLPTCIQTVDRPG